MKSRFLMFAGVLLAVAFFTGCAAPRSNFEMPLPKVEFKTGAKVKVTTVGNANVLPYLKRRVENIFVQNGGQVVSYAPDYWVVVYAAQETRQDSSADENFNLIYGKASREYGNVVEEYVTVRKYSTAANAHFASIVIYDAKTLTPMVNFDLPFYSSSFSDEASRSSLRSESDVASSFSQTLNKILVFSSSK